MLCELPELHGALFVWLEAQLHEHGPLNWGALRTEMAGQAFESLALRLMAEAAPAAVQGEESLLELQGLVLRLAIDRIDGVMKDLAQSTPDAAMAQRYRAMQEKRSPLAAQLDALVKKMAEKV
jgi:DNA primase